MTQKMETACSNGYLWPPVHDALDTYLRRKVNGAEPYERTWRLIHVWEACAITLALAVLSRVRAVPELSLSFLRMREAFHGVSWDEMKRSFRTVAGAKDGSIDQWIGILDFVTRIDQAHQSRFLAAASAFLVAPGIDVTPLVDGWARACDAPRDSRQSEAKVLEAMRHVNSFRNRFAHVPFPHDPLAQIADALESVTEKLFSVEPEPLSHEKSGKSSALTGALRIGRRFLRGGQQDVLANDAGSELQFVFPCRRSGEVESWPASAFIYSDGMSRVHVLTRLKGYDVCEYTRFRAEANAVFVREDGGSAKACPVPDVGDYPTEPAQEIEEPLPLPTEPTEPVVAPAPPQPTLLEAIEAIRLDQFDRAIDILERITSARPNYHVAWLRLGHARREAAVRLGETDPQLALPALRQAISELDKARQHSDERYQALAIYERSKTHYQIYRFTRASGEWAAAEKFAKEAIKINPEPKYDSWIEYLDSRRPSEDED